MRYLLCGPNVFDLVCIQLSLRRLVDFSASRLALNHGHRLISRDSYRRSLHVNMEIIVVINEMVRFYRCIDPLNCIK